MILGGYLDVTWMFLGFYLGDIGVIFGCYLDVPWILLG